MRIKIITAAFRTIIGVWVALSVVACGGSSSGGGTASREPVYIYTVPADIGDGWQVADLTTAGFDADRIADMMQRVLDGRFPGIDSVTIAKNNQLLLYWYAERELDQFDRWVNNKSAERHVLHSTSKSFTSALVGIAIDQGHIASTEVRFYDLFPYLDYANWDPRKADMTLEDVLTMRLGLRWDEWSKPYTDPENDLVFLENNHRDWSRALLDLPLASDPGTDFTYNTAATIALGQAVENATGMPLADFANSYLFYPLQISTAEWWETPTGLPNGGSGLFLTGRDLLKFGQLYVDGGQWHGQQLLSADWIADTVVRRVDISSWASYSVAYGFQWWLDDLTYKNQRVETWVTSGYGGQYLFAMPSLDLVVAFTGHNYDNGVGPDALYTMMQSYILGAID
ncbi:MAG: beta-lactamase family protein [Woeseiaceae bacterium]|nr:beta-lactamase family protein [Woeseiaceae bacterium]